jgi:hypothetical protein
VGKCEYGSRCKFAHVIADKAHAIEDRDWEDEAMEQQQRDHGEHVQEQEHEERHFEEEVYLDDAEEDRTHAIDGGVPSGGEESFWWDFDNDEEQDGVYTIGDDGDSEEDVVLTQARPVIRPAPDQTHVHRLHWLVDSWGHAIDNPAGRLSPCQLEQDPEMSGGSDSFPSTPSTDEGSELPADHFEWHVRCLKRDRQAVPSQLLEALDLEQSPSRRSPIKKRVRPILDRQPLYYTTEFAGDIMALQAKSILHDAAELRRAYVDSDVESASGSLDSRRRSSSEGGDDGHHSTQRQLKMTRCGCGCSCNNVAVGADRCRICAQGVCGQHGDAGLGAGALVEFPSAANTSATFVDETARVIVLSPTGRWIVESQDPDIYDTTDLSLLHFVADGIVDVQQTIVDGLNSMRARPDISRSDLLLVRPMGIPGRINSDLYLVQLRDGALVSTNVHLLHSDPRDLGIHRSCSMHLRGALEAAKAWATAQIETGPPEDFRSARRGEKITRD